MLPFQTLDFDPGDPQLVRRISASPRLHEGFHVNASGHELDGERWILLSTQGYVPGILQAAYPLPPALGRDVHQALSAFQDAWRVEAVRLGLVTRLQEARKKVQEGAEGSSSTMLAVHPKSKRRKPRPFELEGAVALPGLADWLQPGATSGTS